MQLKKFKAVGTNFKKASTFLNVAHLPIIQNSDEILLFQVSQCTIIYSTLSFEITLKKLQRNRNANFCH